VRGSLCGRWDAGRSEVVERGCGRDGGEAEMVLMEDGGAEALNGGVGKVEVRGEPWVCLGQVLLNVWGAWDGEPLTL